MLVENHCLTVVTGNFLTCQGGIRTLVHRERQRAVSGNTVDHSAISIKASLVLGQEIYFTSLITYLMFIYHSKMSTLFSSILAHQAASMGSLGFLDSD